MSSEVLKAYDSYFYHPQEAADQERRLAEEEWRAAEENFVAVCKQGCMWEPRSRLRLQMAAERRSAAHDRRMRAMGA